MATLKFNLPTLSAKKMTENYTVTKNNAKLNVVSFDIDYDNPRELRKYLKNVNEYNDNAMFFQIREIVGKNIDWGIDSLTKYILFVDFSEVFKSIGKTTSRELLDSYSEEKLNPKTGDVKKEYLIYRIFKNGLNLSFVKNDGKKEIIRFVPFDKSGSMSRESKISFINESILKDLNKRLNLDMNLEHQQVNLSKYYAYRGLYLSEGVRTDFSEDILNSEKVIIINDESTIVAGQDIITAERNVDSKAKWSIVKKREAINIKEVYDGEGIVSSEYARLINKKCNLRGATSFQIRMPFVKGMLHEVDFRNLIKEIFAKKYNRSCTSYYIKDLFGIDRDIMKAEIIMPGSMFKCKNWLKNRVEALKKPEERESLDYMEFYFKQFHEYNHALYISNTNHIFRKGCITPLSYQFLNTLDLTESEFETLIRNHYNRSSDPIGFFADMESYLTSDDYEYYDDLDVEEQQETEGYEENIEQETAKTTLNNTVWKKALEKNPAFVSERTVMQNLKGISYSLKLDGAFGRLTVFGEGRFLSRDLLKFVLDIIKEGFSKENDDFNSYVGYHCLNKNAFFLPQKQISIREKTFYPIFRNPHLSRNEQCVLLPYMKPYDDPENLYNKYFSHLNGIIMVGYKSLAPYILGGADFDGDIVKIVDDENIRSAILRGVYEEKSEKETDDFKIQNYERKIPIVIIPSPEAQNSVGVSATPQYSVIKNTFSNSIGKISNLSIQLGAIEYDNLNDTVLELGNTCAACTILTGLEIDAAKTGVHPDLSGIMEFLDSQPKGNDYLYGFKDRIDRLKKNGIYINGEQIKKIDKDGLKIYEFRIHKKDITPYFRYEYKEGMRNIDKLPKYFLDYILERTRIVNREVALNKNGTNKLFVFDDIDSGINVEKIREKINTDRTKEKISAIMYTYYQILKLSSSLYKRREYLKKTNFEGRIRTIVDLQYDDEEKEGVIEDLEKFRAYLKFFVKDSVYAKKAVEEIREHCWPFVYTEDEKKRIMNGILRFEDSYDFESDFGLFLSQDETPRIEEAHRIIELINNFDGKGYNLLYYLLEDVGIVNELMEGPEDLDDESEQNEDNDGLTNDIDKEIFDKFYRKLYRLFVFWDTVKKEKWKKEALSICKEEIHDILESADITERTEIIYLFYLLKYKKNADKNGVFFWDVLTSDDVDKYILKQVKSYDE